MGTQAESTRNEALGQNEGPSQEASGEAVRRHSESREEAMPSEGWSEKRVEKLCDRLLCLARESSSRTEERSFCAGGRRCGGQASSTDFHATSDPEWGQKKGNPEAADQVLGL